MAIYHLHVKVFSKANGKNIVAAAAYRHAAKMIDEEEVKVWNYQSKKDVTHKEIMLPSTAPAWIKELVDKSKNVDKASEKLWNLVTKTETRTNAQFAREAEFALPIELTPEQSIHLAREFIHDQFVLRGMVADWCVHADEGNPHVHVLLTMRSLDNNGFGLKVREWNKSDLLKEWRQQWAEYTNFHLRLHQHEVQIDHRSYKDQGIDLIPTIHQGKAVSDMHERGTQTGIMKEANQIKYQNLKRIAEKPTILLNKITKETDTFTKEKLAQEFRRYVDDQINFPKKILSAEEIANILKTIEHHESVFAERNLAIALNPLVMNAEDFAKALIEVKSSTEVIPIGIGQDGRERFTTRKMFNLENRLQTLADNLQKRYHFTISAKKLNSKNLSGLTDEQLTAVKHILKPHSISCLVGRAGTGKSFSLSAAKSVWEASNLKVQGVALSGVAADGLQKDAGINSRTIASFCYAIEKGHLTLNDRDVIVMDEAGMADSISLLNVLEAVQKAKAKIVLVGDPAQLQPVGPGASFRALVERLGFAEIQTIYRQKETWQKEATVHFSAGNIHQGLKTYQEHDCIHFESTQEESQAKLITDWMTLRVQSSKDLSEYLVLAHRNQDVATLNILLRNERIKQGEIVDGYEVNTQKGTLKIAKDERILFLKNDRQLGVSNGRFATIQSVDFSESGKVRSFTAQLDGTKENIRIDPKLYNHFTYGYTATIHKTQGKTVDHAFLYAGGKAWNRNLAYVGLSRHRETCHLYAGKDVHPTFLSLTRNLSRLSTKDSLLDYPQAFAERRGIDNTNLVNTLIKNIKERLKKWTNNLTNKINRKNQLNTLNTENTITHTQTKTPPSFEDLLKQYVSMELEQTRLVHAMYASRSINDPIESTKASDQAISHSNAIKTFSAKLIEHPTAKEELQAIKSVRIPSLADRGGFKGIYDKISQEEWSKEDRQMLLLQLRGRANDYHRSLLQYQNRSRHR